MSLYYEHLLIPAFPEYRPDAQCVADFMQGIVENGYVVVNPEINFASIARCEPRVREVHNPMTNETVRIHGPSRKLEKRMPVATTSEIFGFANDGVRI